VRQNELYVNRPKTSRLYCSDKCGSKRDGRGQHEGQLPAAVAAAVRRFYDTLVRLRSCPTDSSTLPIACPYRVVFPFSPFRMPCMCRLAGLGLYCRPTRLAGSFTVNHAVSGSMQVTCGRRSLTRARMR